MKSNALGEYNAINNLILMYPSQSHSHAWRKKERLDNLYTTSKDRTRKNKSDEATREKVDEKWIQ